MDKIFSLKSFLSSSSGGGTPLRVTAKNNDETELFRKGQNIPSASAAPSDKLRQNQKVGPSVKFDNELASVRRGSIGNKSGLRKLSSQQPATAKFQTYGLVKTVSDSESQGEGTPRSRAASHSYGCYLETKEKTVFDQCEQPTPQKMLNNPAGDVQLFRVKTKDFFTETQQNDQPQPDSAMSKQRKVAPCRATECCIRDDPNPECQQGAANPNVYTSQGLHNSYKWVGEYDNKPSTAEPDLHHDGSKVALLKRESLEYIIEDDTLPNGRRDAIDTKLKLMGPCRRQDCCTDESGFKNKHLVSSKDCDFSFRRNLEANKSDSSFSAQDLSQNAMTVSGYFRSQCLEFGHNDDHLNTNASDRESTGKKESDEGNITEGDVNYQSATSDVEKNPDQVRVDEMEEQEASHAKSSSTIRSFLAKDVDQPQPMDADMSLRRKMRIKDLDSDSDIIPMHLKEMDGLLDKTLFTKSTSAQCVSALHPDDAMCLRLKCGDDCNLLKEPTKEESLPEIPEVKPCQEQLEQEIEINRTWTRVIVILLIVIVILLVAASAIGSYLSKFDSLDIAL
ncbi:unnamed protein product [Clavelina lepadiformis]|uniref:Uncharacterized protein n=1 Tax=Clavelina lepadiformis TaxID=159417 RepID=A0ABP0GGH6_CLALP